MVPWMVFADGLSCEDYLHVLWEGADRKGRAGYKYSQHGDGSVYTLIHTTGNAITQAQRQHETNLQA